MQVITFSVMCLPHKQEQAQHSQCEENEPTHDTACDDGSLGAATSRGIWIGRTRLKDVGSMGEEGLAAGERGMSEGQVRVMLECWWHGTVALVQWLSTKDKPEPFAASLDALAAQNTIRFIDASTHQQQLKKCMTFAFAHSQ
jgi:hypothetical protein